MRYLFCLAFITMTLSALNVPIKAEPPKEDVTLVIIASYNSSSSSDFEFLTLRASRDLISWSFHRDNRSQNEKGEFDSKEIQSSEGKIIGEAERLTAAFSKVLNLEKQTLKSPQNKDISENDYISPHNFALILMDSTGVKTCQLSHKQQVELSHSEEMKPIFDIVKTSIATDKRIMIRDLFYAGYEYPRSISKPTTSGTGVSELPPVKPSFPTPTPRNNYPTTKSGDFPSMKFPSNL
jgi:hypothetical protein